MWRLFLTYAEPVQHSISTEFHMHGGMRYSRDLDLPGVAVTCAIGIWDLEAISARCRKHWSGRIGTDSIPTVFGFSVLHPSASAASKYRTAGWGNPSESGLYRIAQIIHRAVTLEVAESLATSYGLLQIEQAMGDGWKEFVSVSAGHPPRMEERHRVIREANSVVGPLVRPPYLGGTP